MKNLKELFDIVEDRRDNPTEGSYTNMLLDHEEKVYRKLNEEAYETIYACLKEDKNQVIYEAGDLLYHLTTLLVKNNVSYEEILAELSKRKK